MTHHRIIAIDPGKGATGVALFAQGDGFTRGGLVHAALWRKEPWESVKGLDKLVDWIRVVDGLPTYVVIESQQVYRGDRRSNPATLIALAQRAGGWAAIVSSALLRFHEVRCQFVMPKQWKGSVPKEVHQRRILHALRPEESNLLRDLDVPASKLHNVVDAVGIGLWAQGHIKEERT